MRPASKRAIRLAIAATALLGMGQVLAQSGDEDENDEANNEPTPVDSVLEEVIVSGRFIGQTGRSALKSDVPLRDVPVSVSSYTEDFMNAIETLNISNLYDYMVGVQRAGNTAYDVTIRGFASTASDRNTIMVDGLPGQTVRWGSPPTINAERVEVVKGPASVLYGQVQPGGFINIVTKKPQAEKFTWLRVRGQSYFGDQANASDSFGYTVSLDSTGAISKDGNWMYRFVAEYGDNPGFRDFGRGDSTYAVPSLTWLAGDHTSITAYIEYRKETVSLDDGLIAPDNAQGVPDYRLIDQDITTYYGLPGSTNSEKGTVYALTFAHEFSSTLEWRGAFRGVDHDDQREGLDMQGTRTCSPDSVAGMMDPTAICVRRRQRDQSNIRKYYFVDTNLTWNLEFGSSSHQIMFGFNGGQETANFERIDFGVNNNTYDINLYNPVHFQGTPNAPRPQTWTKTTYDSYAFYLQDQISIGDYWKVLVGGRYEDFDIQAVSLREMDDSNWRPSQSTKGDSFVPMAGVLFQPNDQMTYYVSYTESFNPPPPGRTDEDGNIFTDPEEGSQYEAGIKYEMPDGRGSITGSVFQITKKNSLQGLGSTGIFVQTGEEESTGFEIEGDISFMDRWQILIGYAYIDAKVKDDVDTGKVGQQLRNAPKSSFSMWNQIQLTDAFSMGLGVSYVSQRFGTVPDSNGDSQRLVLPSYTVMDLAFYYVNVQHGINVTFKYGNILDEQYYESAFAVTRISPGAPANITLSVSKSFF